jgi:integrase/recombinase XerD
MARRGMGTSEVLKLTPEDIEDRKLILRDPKSGRGIEVAFVPWKVADRLKNCVQKKATDWFLRHELERLTVRRSLSPAA